MSDGLCKPKLFIKTYRLVVNGIHHDGIDCDLVTDRLRSLNRMDQQHLSDPLSLSSITHSQPADQGSGNENRLMRRLIS